MINIEGLNFIFLLPVSQNGPLKPGGQAHFDIFKSIKYPPFKH